jgi:hypothetical protein
MEANGVTSPLPEGWSVPVAVEDTIVADGVAIQRAGISTIAPDGEEICGSAADVGGRPSARAWFELLERVSAVEALQRGGDVFETKDAAGRPSGVCSRKDVLPESSAPDVWRYARSNGVALHVGWATACERALLELAERDRVLRAWHGEIRPEPLPFDARALGVEEARSYAFSAYGFPEEDTRGFSRGIHVVGVFGFPLRDDLPFVAGYAGRSALEAALTAATREAVQLLAFLWGEPLPDGSSSAPTAMAHLDTYQVRGAHRTIRSWLEGGHLRHGRHAPEARARAPVAYVDLTPSWLTGGLRVARAVCAEATPLVFGASPLAAHLPAELRIHPIA